MDEMHCTLYHYAQPELLNTVLASMIPPLPNPKVNIIYSRGKSHLAVGHHPRNQAPNADPALPYTAGAGISIILTQYNH